MAKIIVATAQNAAEAQNVVNRLIGDGYPVDSMSVLADSAAVYGLDDIGVNVENSIDYSDTDEGLWARIKDFFGVGDREEYTDLVSAHRQDIQNGSVLVLVDDQQIPDNLYDDLYSRDTTYWEQNLKDEDRAPVATKAPDMPAQYVDEDEDETLRLRQERLNVDKRNVQAGDVVVQKRVVETNETINVPVMHEEVVIQRRPVNDMAAATDVDFKDETITIPLWQEEVNVTKQPVVTEEVHIGKNRVEGNQQVSEKLRREELDVQKDGNVVLRDSDETSPKL